MAMAATTYLTLLYVTIILVGVFALTFKWVIFGLLAKFRKSSGKYGLLFIKNQNNNIGIPKLISLDLQKIEIKKKKVTRSYIINRNEFHGSTIFGFPFCIKDFDDASRSYGLYAPVLGKDHNPLFETVLIEKEGKSMNIQTDIPKLSTLKIGTSFDPEIIDAITAKSMLLDGFKEFMQKYKLLIIVGVIAAGAAIGAAYFGYNIYNRLVLDIGPNVAKCASAAAKSTAPLIVPVS